MASSLIQMILHLVLIFNVMFIILVFFPESLILLRNFICFLIHQNVFLLKHYFIFKLNYSNLIIRFLRQTSFFFAHVLFILISFIINQIRLAGKNSLEN